MFYYLTTRGRVKVRHLRGLTKQESEVKGRIICERL
jgi:hypothetical protein